MIREGREALMMSRNYVEDFRLHDDGVNGVIKSFRRFCDLVGVGRNLTDDGTKWESLLVGFLVAVRISNFMIPIY